MEMVVVNRLGYGKTHKQPVLDFNAQAKIIEPFLDEKRTLLLGIFIWRRDFIDRGA